MSKLFNHKDNNRLRDTLRVIGGLIFSILLLLPFVSFQTTKKIIFQFLDIVVDFIFNILNHILSIFPAAVKIRILDSVGTLLIICLIVYFIVTLTIFFFKTNRYCWRQCQ